MLYGGAAGPGKSYILRWWLALLLADIHTSLHLKNVHVGLFSEDYPSLYDRQISKIEVEFPPWLGHLRRGSTHEFILNKEYGSGVIALRNLDDPSKYLSAEFAAIGVDELTRNSKNIFDFLRLRLRWPGMDKPLFGAATNPGGKGHVWVKNYWKDGVFPPEMRPIAHEFKFIPALPTDNPHLAQRYFDNLATQPEQMRKAYLEGDWNLLAGQYFPEDTLLIDNSIGPEHMKPWWPRWIGGDWGFAHPTAWYWLARSTDGHIYCYREFHERGLGEVELGEKITELSAGEKIDAVFLGPDAFAKRTSAHTIAQQIGEVLRKHGIPEPTEADNDRKGGARLMSQLFKAKMLTIANCPKLVECLPTLLHDEEDLEDVMKVDATDGNIGDDPYDAVRYACKSYLSPKGKPFQVELTERLDAVPDFTKKHMLHKMLVDQHGGMKPDNLIFRPRRAQRQFYG